MKRRPLLGLSLSLAGIAVVVVACSGSTTNTDVTTGSDGGPSSSTDSAGNNNDVTTNPITDSGNGTGDSTSTTDGGAFSFTASAAPAAAAGSKVIVVWSVSSGSPDYLYSFGSGSTAGTQVFVTFSSSPPAEALNVGKLGIGLVATVDANTNVPEGKMPKAELDKILMITPDHAIIFRNTTETLLKNGWDKDFPQGFACGQCVRQDSGFDSFEKVDCSAVKLVPKTASTDFCNWT